ncbi:MAG: hypothetical protein A2X13_07690 [Bacteroidetes bacterium GWC2_33_15]|nr:MAG: hypothetical protein A2X10_01545 [Bacteroidetes bacterium GWA2_33_15]OFX48667.1 MAG: hypothetical protein A2X13_07690 [Bacteroidetes bacterium GWC2_33_15]OFX64641.1 MAG: hypothetical protein A2X15_05280 [Bacteroidetes bacterium GWB2_32_14]OFX67941.1 MAG: hypothetical protein A2X14_01495 [Bacteroidetes bacterium GWD2_33_33]HAN18172.1 hypothetical protein [Bacteroidales bacterium]
MRKLLITFLIVFLQLPLIAQINKNGIPFIQNFSKDDYNAHEQNWAVCADNRGVVYFGNHEGVIEYDGINWNTIPVTNNSTIRSLAVDSLGTIYVGAVGEFGYLAPDTYGKMKYISLFNKNIDSLNVGDVWKTYCIGSETYFCAGSSIFKFKNKKFENFYRDTLGGFISFYINNRLILGNYFHGLKELKNDQFALIKGGDFYKEKDVFVILPLSEKELFIGTMVNGNYIYNVETGESKDIEKYSKKFNFLSHFLKDAQLYNGIQLKNGNYVLTTVNNGLIIINKQGEILQHITKENGLGDITVTNAFESGSVLWLSLFNYLSYVEINSPFTKFDSKNGIEGMIIDTERFKGTLYVATSLGLYYQYFDENGFPAFKIVEGLDQMVWTLEKIITNDNKERLLAGSSVDVYEIMGVNKIKVIKYKDGLINCSCLFQSKFDKNRIYVGYRDGLTYIEYKNDNWITQENRYRFSESIETIAQDKNKNLWLGTSFNGIIQFNPEKEVLTRYGLNEGLPSLDGNRVCLVNNDILIAAKGGIYSVNPENNKIEKYDKFPDFKTRTDKIIGIFQENDSIFWIISKHINKNNIENYQYVEKLIQGDTRKELIDIPFRRVKNHNILNVSFDDDGSVWFLSTIAALNYNSLNEYNFSDTYYSLNRKVSLQIDSIIFFGTNYIDTTSNIVSVKQPENLKNVLDYKQNNITFYYSSPYFPNEDIKYSYKLEGFEKEWSNWDIKTYKEYTNMNEGSYIFKIKALNIYGIESEIAEYEFSILPPWYRTVWAYMLYFIFAIAVIAVVVKLYTRKLQLEKIRLEQIVKERTEEVVKQKDEIEKQRDEIADKNKSITDSIEYAKRIQNAVLPSKELAQEILPEHFILFRPRDIVSGDFYWFTKKDNLLIIIAADCTGHGVPGAFMSMLGVSFINEIVNKHEVIYAGDILTHLRADVKRTLSQTGKEGEAKDGMDIALCIVDLEKMKMQYAGAYNPMYMFRNNELIEYKADRMPIGIYVKERETFTNNEIDLQKGDVFYIFSDGYQDQFGGETGEKFKTKNFKEYLQQIHKKPMAEQRELLNTNIDKWRGRWEQVDDIIVLGVRI